MKRLKAVLHKMPVDRYSVTVDKFKENQYNLTLKCPFYKNTSYREKWGLRW